MEFSQLLDTYGVPHRTEGHHHCRPGWVQMDCPFCAEQNKYHLGYNLTYGYVNCWKCGSHSVQSTLAMLTHLPYGKVKELLRGVKTTRKPEKLRITGRYTPPEGVGPLQPAHKRYLEGRGFDVATIQTLWKVKGLGMHGQLAWRLFIPIEYHGETVSWSTRTIGTKGSRYISATPKQETLQHKTLLYGEDYVRDSIIICEGPLDVWRIGPGAVATFGTSFGMEQIHRMGKYRKRFICLDNNKDAQRRAQRLLDTLTIYDGETVNVVLDSSDPGEATIIEVQRIRKLAGLE